MHALRLDGKKDRKSQSSWIGLLFFFGGLLGVCAQPYWPQFRGPAGCGVADAAHPPLRFDGTNGLLWRTEVAPGHSSPCIWGDRIFLTSIHDKQLECRAYDRIQGKLLWTRLVPAKAIERTHNFSNPAASTPVADDQRVIFYLGSFGFLCYTHDGEEVWRRELPPPVSQYGTASSPILLNELVVQTLDTDEGDSRLLAVKRSTGETAWETPRPLFKASWSTPSVWRHGGETELIVLSSKQLVSYDPATGSPRWSVGGFPLQVAPSLAIEDDLLFACAAGIGGRSNPKSEGFLWTQVAHLDLNKNGKIEKAEIPDEFRIVQRPELPDGHPGRQFPFPLTFFLGHMDKDKDDAITEQEWNEGRAAFESMDSPVLMAIRASEAGRGDTNRVVWNHAKGIPEVPSPLCYNRRVYLIRDGGLLQCLDAANGNVLYKERVGVPGGYSASPLGADGRVYLASQSGTIVVLEAASNELKVLARNHVGGQITATPAFAKNCLYVRTDQHLAAYGTSQPQPELSSLRDAK
jgi:outer membrane protein assembly factor BamB